jgi:hypothetical protein
MSPKSLRFLTDNELLAQARMDLFRGPGPGGQKRNKTSNSVRLTHLPTGIHVIAGESRSQVENKTRAVRRLRLKLAAEIREPIDAAKFEPPDWFLSIRHNRQIEASHRHPYYAPMAGLLLDLLKVLHGSPADVGIMLGVSTTEVVKFLEQEPHLWEAANHIRADLGIKPLTHRR